MLLELRVADGRKYFLLEIDPKVLKIIREVNFFKWRPAKLYFMY